MVNADVDVAYIAPPEVNAVRFVPPLAVGRVPVVKTDVEVAYTAPPEVNEVKFVPPFVVANVPPTVTAPAVAVEGVNPVEPKDRVVTATPLKVDHCGAVAPELTVKTWPAVPMARVECALVPAPYPKAPTAKDV